MPYNTHTLLAQRREKDAFFRESPDSPLPPDQQATFGGLRYYPPNPDLALEVQVIPIDDPKQVAIMIPTTTDTIRRYDRYGRITFTVNGEPVTLTIYAAPHGLFLPFTDSNAGGDTYSAGRYLEPQALGEDRVYVDFNVAYNPYCAYSDGWSCPITPAENRLAVAIMAGEMSPQG
jgi:uncharacterized protein